MPERWTRFATARHLPAAPLFPPSRRFFSCSFFFSWVAAQWHWHRGPPHRVLCCFPCSTIPSLLVSYVPGCVSVLCNHTAVSAACPCGRLCLVGNPERGMATELSLLESPCGRTLYPAPFGSRQHVLYIAQNLAVHAVCWGFVYVWTTFFGLLRDHKDPEEFLTWGVGALLFTASAIMTSHTMRSDFLLREVSFGIVMFYSSAAVCTLCAGRKATYLSERLMLPAPSCPARLSLTKARSSTPCWVLTSTCLQSCHRCLPGDAPVLLSYCCLCHLVLMAAVSSYNYKMGDVALLPDVGFAVIPKAVPGTWQAKISGTLALLTR